MRYREIKEAQKPAGPKFGTDQRSTFSRFIDQQFFGGQIGKDGTGLSKYATSDLWQFQQLITKELQSAINSIVTNPNLADQPLQKNLESWFTKKYQAYNPNYVEQLREIITKVVNAFEQDGKKFGPKFTAAAQEYSKEMYAMMKDTEQKKQAADISGAELGVQPADSRNPNAQQSDPDQSSILGPDGKPLSQQSQRKQKTTKQKQQAQQTQQSDTQQSTTQQTPAQSTILQNQGLLKSIQALSSDMLQKLKGVLSSIVRRKQPANEGLGSWLGQKASSLVNFGTDTKRAYQKGREQANLMDYQEILRQAATLNPTDAKALLGYVNSIIKGNAPAKPAAQKPAQQAAQKTPQKPAQPTQQPTVDKLKSKPGINPVTGKPFAKGQPVSATPQGGGRVKGAGLSQTPNAIRKREARAAAKTAQQTTTQAAPTTTKAAPQGDVTQNYPNMQVNVKQPAQQGLNVKMPNVKMQTMPGQKPAATAPAQQPATPPATQPAAQKPAVKKAAAKPRQPKAMPPMSWGGEKYTKGPKGWVNSKNKLADQNTANVLDQAAAKYSAPKRKAKTAPATVNEQINIVEKYLRLLENRLN